MEQWQFNYTGNLQTMVKPAAKAVGSGLRIARTNLVEEMHLATRTACDLNMWLRHVGQHVASGYGMHLPRNRPMAKRAYVRLSACSAEKGWTGVAKMRQNPGKRSQQQDGWLIGAAVNFGHHANSHCLENHTTSMHLVAGWLVKRRTCGKVSERSVETGTVRILPFHSNRVSCFDLRLSLCDRPDKILKLMEALRAGVSESAQWSRTAVSDQRPLRRNWMRELTCTPAAARTVHLGHLISCARNASLNFSAAKNISCGMTLMICSHSTQA